MKDYLKEEYREFGYYPIPEKLEKTVDVLETHEIIKALDNTYNRHTGTILDRTKHDLYLRELWNRLEIASTRDVFNLIVEITSEIENQLTELRNQFKNHRHDANKSYTEKPAW